MQYSISVCKCQVALRRAARVVITSTITKQFLIAS
jgi:hypothetical protein